MKASDNMLKPVENILRQLGHPHTNHGHNAKGTPFCQYGKRVLCLQRGREVSVEIFRKEVTSRQRFEFGRNWKSFLRTLNDDRIGRAESSLKEMFEIESLKGKTFLDIGCGSGLFSLAARNLGAKVVSFDFDDSSVWCTSELQSRYYKGDASWAVMQGSVLDDGFLKTLGEFDYVYSWGVLHHTGEMWRALDSVCALVKPEGKLFIAIYNDQGGTSRRWLFVKRLYNMLPRFLRPVFSFVIYFPIELKHVVIQCMRLKLYEGYVKYISNYSDRSRRGMSWWHDKIDWIGGLPFEVAKPEEVFNLYRGRGFVLERLRTASGGHGCCQYVFSRTP